MKSIIVALSLSALVACSVSPALAFNGFFDGSPGVIVYNTFPNYDYVAPPLHDGRWGENVTWGNGTYGAGYVAEPNDNDIHTQADYEASWAQRTTWNAPK